MRFIDPRTDFAFKKIFGSPEGLEPLREALLIVLDARGFVLTPDQASRIAAASHLELDGWLRRASMSSRSTSYLPADVCTCSRQGRRSS